MHMVPVTDPKELEVINAWADTQQVEGLFPGWVTWKFVDDSGKFCGFYQQGQVLHGHFHVAYEGNKTQSLRALLKAETLTEALGVAPLLTLPESSPLHALAKQRYQVIQAPTFVCAARRA